jgi:uncharacterized repeat protein (TIGR01451 family)
MLVAGAASAFAATPDPNKVSFTLEGCRLQAGETLPNASGKFVCPDADYTTGNLGKLWNELDLVPFRLTADSGLNQAQTYAVAIALDGCDAGTCLPADIGTPAYGRPGYDVIGSDGAGGTPTVKSGGCTVTDAGQQTKNPGVGGTQATIYRILTITQPANTTCVFDWYGRLALGSHLYPGSSLHANLLNQTFGTSGIGAKDVSIPVKEILPQELSKDMTASRDQDHVWSITKDLDGAPVDFSDTCDPENRSASITVTVTWKRLPAAAGGAITAVTNITVTNPAHRTITVNVSDDIRSGTTVIDTASVSDVDVAPGVHTVLTHTTPVLAGTTNLNDVATAHYVDKDTGVTIPGQTTATASATVQPSGTVTNESAGIHDEEAITGDGLSFSVDSTSGASGALTDENGDPYVVGTAVGPGHKVVWDSANQAEADLSPSSDPNDPAGTLVGSVTFDKTIYVDGRRATSGSIADEATLTASDGFTASTSASGDISSPGCGTITIKKETDPPGATQEFTFSSDVDAFDGASLADGDSVSSGSLTPGTYSVSEDELKAWKLSSVTCSNDSSPDEIVVAADEDVTCTFHNTHLGAAIAITKVVAEDHAYDGDTLHYTITVSNLGKDGANGDATDVKLGDLIQGTSHGCDSLPTTPGTVTPDSGDATDPGVLNVGETWVFHCTYKVLHAEENASHEIVNVATVNATDTDGGPLGPKSAQAVTPVFHPAIALDKTGPATAQAGDKVAYILTLTNPGDESFAEATVKVTDAQCNGDPVTLIGKGGDASPGSFDPGDTWTYTCSVQTAVGDTAINNVAVVTAADKYATAVNAASGAPGTVSATDPASTALAQPAQIVAPIRITPGAARLLGPTGCTAKAFSARVRGTKIATVAFILDGKVVKRVKNTKNAKLIALRIKPTKLKLGVHRLVVNVTFQSGSGTKPKTMRLSFQRCGKKLVAPRFTG